MGKDGGVTAPVVDRPLADARLIVPADPRSLRLARLTASSLAADLDWSVDDIDDLRIAVDELCAAIIVAATPTAPLDIAFERTDEGLAIEGMCETADESEVRLDPFAREMLELTTTRFEVDGDGSTRRFRLEKRPTNPDV